MLKRGPRPSEPKPPVPPTIDGLDMDLRMNGFDVMALHSLKFGDGISSPQATHMKIFGKLKFNGRVPGVNPASDDSIQAESTTTKQLTRMVGDVSLVGLKLNQFLVAPNLAGSLDISPASLKVSLRSHLNFKYTVRRLRSSSIAVQIMF